MPQLTPCSSIIVDWYPLRIQQFISLSPCQKWGSAAHGLSPVPTRGAQRSSEEHLYLSVRRTVASMIRVLATRECEKANQKPWEQCFNSCLDACGSGKYQLSKLFMCVWLTLTFSTFLTTVSLRKKIQLKGDRRWLHFRSPRQSCDKPKG